MADPRAPRKRRTRADLPRLTAYDVLTKVRVDGAYTNLILPTEIRARGLSTRDAGFVTELVSGTIRRQGTYDAIIDANLTRPKLEAKVRDALRLGSHQLLSMRVPTHAAISSTVDLVRDRIGVGPAGLTNAVLRRISELSLDQWVRRLGPPPDADEFGFLALAQSHPKWVVAGLAAALERSNRRDELDALLAADNLAPRVTLVARPGLADRSELPGEPTALSPFGVVLEGGDPGAIPAVADGRAGVQDEGSQLVAWALADARLDGRDERWLDACAGPGGKAALLAALAGQRGIGFVAAERQPHRAALVKNALRAIAAPVVCADTTTGPWPDESFDRILLDVPCTGLGALRRRPEARWRRLPSDVAELVALQKRILDTALHVVRRGGLVGYATCSPLLEETVDVVAPILDEGRASILPIPGATGPLDGTMQLWPHVHGTDAMFLALLRRED